VIGVRLAERYTRKQRDPEAPIERCDTNVLLVTPTYCNLVAYPFEIFCRTRGELLE
jgi:hypothetical protein